MRRAQLFTTAASEAGPQAVELLHEEINAASDYMMKRTKVFGNLQIAFLFAAAVLLVLTKIDFYKVIGILP